MRACNNLADWFDHDLEDRELETSLRIVENELLEHESLLHQIDQTIEDLGHKRKKSTRVYPRKTRLPQVKLMHERQDIEQDSNSSGWGTDEGSLFAATSNFSKQWRAKYLLEPNELSFNGTGI